MRFIDFHGPSFERTFLGGIPERKGTALRDINKQQWLASSNKGLSPTRTAVFIAAEKEAGCQKLVIVVHQS